MSPAMAVYLWKGRNRYGDPVKGERVARSPEELARALQKEQITVSAIVPRKERLELPFFKREHIRLK